MPTFVVRNVFHDRAVLHVRAVFREVGVVPAQCFGTRACFYRDRVAGENGAADVDRHDGR